MTWWKAQRSKEPNSGDHNCFYIYDERMLLHTDYDDHPECPLRIKSIFEYLKANGFTKEMTKLNIVESEEVV